MTTPAHPFVNEPGWFGSFTRQQAPGAIPNGARVRKRPGYPRDRTPALTEGIVLGSVSHPELGIAYFVEWDDKPRVALGVIAKKLERVLPT